MTSEAKAAVENSFHFEAKKDGLRQAQSGQWTLSFKVLPEDIPYGLLKAPMGTRFVVAACEKGDDETAVQQPPEAKQTPKPEKPKATNRIAAVMLCKNPQFWQFLDKTDWVGTADEETAAKWLRGRCGVESRTELDGNKPAATKFWDIHREFELWRSGEVA